MYKITQIFDGDYGCEELQPNEKQKVTVYLMDENGNEKSLRIEDAWLIQHGLDVGSEWPDIPIKPKTEKSTELYNLMISQGYPEEFADIITKNLNTDFTATRMIGYLYLYDKPSLTDVADEMLAILEDRNRIMEKKELERVNAAWNEFLNNGFGAGEDEERN